MDDVGQRYITAKNDFQEVVLDGCTIVYNDALRHIDVEYGGLDDRKYWFDMERMKKTLFLFSFFLVMMLIAGWNSNLLDDPKFMIYAVLIASLITVVSSIRRKTKIVFDFKNQIVLRNSRKQKFEDIEYAFLDRFTINLVPFEIVTLKTKQGKMDLPLFPVKGQPEEVVEKLILWCTVYLKRNK